jgi:hypothetical protein
VSGVSTLVRLKVCQRRQQKNTTSTAAIPSPAAGTPAGSAGNEEISEGASFAILAGDPAQSVIDRVIIGLLGS